MVLQGRFTLQMSLYNRTLAERVTWPMIFTMEAIVIIVGNALALVVFTRRKFLNKKSNYLLINLSVADLLVGVCSFLNAWLMSYRNTSEEELGSLKAVQKAMEFSSGSASVFSLVGVAIERVYSIFWPIRHRVMPGSIYIAFIIMLWLYTLSVLIMIILTSVPGVAFSYEVVNSLSSSQAFLLLAIIGVSYLAIWIKVTYFSRFQFNVSSKENRKATKTSFIVTLISLGTWLPMLINYQVAVATLPTLYIMVCLFLVYANSFVNIFVYAYRMPQFQIEVKRWLRRSRVSKKVLHPNVVTPSIVPLNVSVLNRSGEVAQTIQSF